MRRELSDALVRAFDRAPREWQGISQALARIELGSRPAAWDVDRLPQIIAFNERVACVYQVTRPWDRHDRRRRVLEAMARARMLPLATGFAHAKNRMAWSALFRMPAARLASVLNLDAEGRVPDVRFSVG